MYVYIVNRKWKVNRNIASQFPIVFVCWHMKTSHPQAYQVIGSEPITWYCQWHQQIRNRK